MITFPTSGIFPFLKVFHSPASLQRRASARIGRETRHRFKLVLCPLHVAAMAFATTGWEIPALGQADPFGGFSPFHSPLSSSCLLVYRAFRKYIDKYIYIYIYIKLCWVRGGSASTELWIEGLDKKRFSLRNSLKATLP